MKYEPIYTWDSATGTATCTINTGKHKFFAMSRCHPNDMDMCSEKTGYQIAFQKVIIQIHKACRDDIKSQICALERLYYSMKHSKQFNPNSYENKSLQRQLHLSKNALTTTNQDIAVEEQNLRTLIKNKDEFYKKIRKNRAKNQKDKSE